MSPLGPAVEWDVCPGCQTMFAAAYGTYEQRQCDACDEHDFEVARGDFD